MSNTPTPPIKLVIGLESHMLPQEELEEVQLVTADGEHFALIEQYPLWENAEFIVKAVNNHDALVAEATELLKNTTWDEDSVGYARVLTQDIEALKATLRAALKKEEDRYV